MVVMGGGVEADDKSAASRDSSVSATRAGTDMSTPTSSSGGPISKAAPTASKKANPITEESDDASKDEKNGSAERHSSGLSTPPPQAQQPSYQQQQYLYQDPHQQHTPYSYYQQVLGPDPSPTSTPSGRYDLQAAFLQQQALSAAGNPFAGTNLYGSALPQLPLSPHPSPRNATNGGGSMGVLPPTSPLFPAGYGPHDPMEPSGMSRAYPNSSAAPPSPSLSYLHSPPTATQSSYAGMYQGYGGYGDPSRSPSSSPQQTWAERSMHQQVYQQASPQLQPQGIHIPYPTGHAQGMSRGNQQDSRTQSFDEMLPPSASSSEQQQDRSQGYSHFATQAAAAASASVNGNSGGATLFSQQQWGYPPSPHLEPYPSVQQQQQQQHHQQPLNIPQMHLPGQAYSTNTMGASVAGQQQRHGGHMQHHGHGGKYHAGTPYYHTSTTPGPPIQTTACNKGPDGANLFIFHIPNHFTNLDMYHLFCKYGTLLSVRIMVEKDTGRSRGFGFVSYDSPESAALAIKELNGFVIGNKRLKVQHKQIRATDHSSSSQHHHQPSYNPGSVQDQPRHPDSVNAATGVNNQTSLDSPVWYGGTQQPSSTAPTSSEGLGPNDGIGNSIPSSIESDDKVSKSRFNKQMEAPEESSNQRDRASATTREESLEVIPLQARRTSAGDGMGNETSTRRGSGHTTECASLNHLSALRDALPDISK